MKPFSTYPEDRDTLLKLAERIELSDGASADAYQLADLVRAILEDEAVAPASGAQDTIDALDEAGRLLAPIIDAERGSNPPAISVRGNSFTVHGFVDAHYKHHVSGNGESLSTAFFDFLAKRSDKLRELEEEERQRADFQAWKAQRECAA